MMKAVTARFGKFAAALVLVAVVALAGCQSAPQTAGEPSADPMVHVKKITYVAEARGTVVKIYTSRKLDYTSYKLADPLRLAVEMPNVALDFEPKRLAVEDEIISAISVVRFTRVNSARLELELQSDAQFKLTQKPDHVEILLTTGGMAMPVARKKSAPTADVAGNAGNQGEKMEALAAENDQLKTENLETRKKALALEEQNAALKRQLDESHKQLEEANSLSKTLQARVNFVETQLSDIESKVSASGASLSGPSLELAAAPVPLPAPSGGAEETRAPSGPSEKGAMIEVNQAVAIWLKAWNRKDLKDYTASYAPGFKTKDMGLEQWIEDKKVKFSTNKPIRVKAKNLKIAVNPDGTATVVFEQQYKAGKYRDKGIKQLVMEKKDWKWLITSEEWSPLAE